MASHCSPAIRLTLLATSAFLLGIGCASKNVDLPDADLVKGISKYRTEAPGESGWKVLKTFDEVRYIATPEKKFDEDVISVYARIIPVGENVGGNAGLRKKLDEEGDPSLEYLQEDELLGRSVVRFRRYVLDAAGNPKDVLEALRLRTRPPGDYFIRGEGVYFLDPKHPERAFEVGVMRNSFHGMIGTSYEQKGADFIDQFILNNELTGFNEVQDLSDGPQS